MSIANLSAIRTTTTLEQRKQQVPGLNRRMSVHDRGARTREGTDIRIGRSRQEPVERDALAGADVWLGAHARLGEPDRYCRRPSGCGSVHTPDPPTRSARSCVPTPRSRFAATAAFARGRGSPPVGGSPDTAWRRWTRCSRASAEHLRHGPRIHGRIAQDDWRSSAGFAWAGRCPGDC
jgi:hypothetical protein